MPEREPSGREVNALLDEARDFYTGGFVRPFSTAHDAICVRESNSNLDKMLLTWLATVR